ncbi:MAG: hypothetical protein JWO95_2188, partial [Verrucomicrobiales bacterium]|nr:hypothetical protein [Verrucomicrobiales bacterium]
ECKDILAGFRWGFVCGPDFRWHRTVIPIYEQKPAGCTQDSGGSSGGDDTGTGLNPPAYTPSCGCCSVSVGGPSEVCVGKTINLSAATAPGSPPQGGTLGWAIVSGISCAKFVTSISLPTVTLEGVADGDITVRATYRASCTNIQCYKDFDIKVHKPAIHIKQVFAARTWDDNPLLNTFLSTDAITCVAEISNACNTTVKWTVRESGNSGATWEAENQGPVFRFVPDSDLAGFSSYRIAQFTSGNLAPNRPIAFDIKAELIDPDLPDPPIAASDLSSEPTEVGRLRQDFKDVLRQEYVDYQQGFPQDFHAPVPGVAEVKTQVPTLPSGVIDATSTRRGINGGNYTPQTTGGLGATPTDAFIDVGASDMLLSVASTFGSGEIALTSGFRNPQRQKKVATARDSRHQYGDALDLRPQPDPYYNPNADQTGRAWLRLYNAARGCGASRILFEPHAGEPGEGSPFIILTGSFPDLDQTNNASGVAGADGLPDDASFPELNGLNAYSVLSGTATGNVLGLMHLDKKGGTGGGNASLLTSNKIADVPLKSTTVKPTAVIPQHQIKSDDNEQGVCAIVRIRLDQTAAMTRSSFAAMLEIDNHSGVSLQQITVTLDIRDARHQPANERFGVRPPSLAGLTAVDGSGTLQGNSTGSANWILIPTSDAAPNEPTTYYVGGRLTYVYNGLPVSIPIFPATIRVMPDPRLQVKYFWQREVFSDDPFTEEVEPAVPFALGVLVNNVGKGTARNMTITSSQPKIIENEKGLLINFNIIGSQVNDQVVSPSLTVNLGDIPPDNTSVAAWLMTASLQGKFIDYKASFQHMDDLGKTNLSLVDSVEIHEMVHLVQAGGIFEDGRPDFLVNNSHDTNGFPDTLYLSNGTTNPVQVVTSATIDGVVTDSHLQVQLTAPSVAGWSYLRIPDPGTNLYHLARIRRSDGVEISFGVNAWTTDRVFVGGGHRPVSDNRLHLLDYNTTGFYTLIYEMPPAPDTVAPTSSVQSLPVTSYSRFVVNWNGADDSGGRGIAFFEIFVNTDGGTFAPWLQHTTLNAAVFEGEIGHSYAFYSVATDGAGNREPSPSVAQAQTSVTLSNRPPSISLPSTVTVTAGNTLLLDVTATDPDSLDVISFSLASGSPAGVVINPVTGHLSWATSPAQGGTTNPISIVVADNGQPSLSVTGAVAVVIAPHVPVIVTQPVSKLRQPQGTDLNFKVSVSGLAPFRYQWKESGSAIPGATGSSYDVSAQPVGSRTNLIFSVLVTDATGSVLSSNATLTIMTDSTAPKLVVKSPAKNARVSSLTLSGTASDKNQLRKVQYWFDNFNHGAVTRSTTNDATLTAGLQKNMNWSAVVSPLPGTNTVTIQAVDLAGNTTSLARKFFYIVRSPFVLTKAGTGTGKLVGKASKRGD